MSFDSISAQAANRHRVKSPASFVESVYDFGARLARHEWQVMLDRWQRLQPYADRFATAFFDTLFEREPAFRNLFGDASLEAQFLRFAHLLTQIVSAEDDREELERRVELIVQRYARDDSETEHSRAIRAAIAATLAEVAGADLTPPMRAAWKSAYTTVGELVRGTTWVGARTEATILQAAVRAELAADRRSSAIQRAMESTSESEAA